MWLGCAVALVLLILFGWVWPQSPTVTAYFGGVFIGFLGALVVETLDG